MVDHLHKPWKVIEEIKKLRTKYGENAKVVEAHKPIQVKATVKHSFPHLIGKHYKVPVGPTNLFSDAQVITSYRITEEDTRRQAARRAREKETSLDNDLGDL